MINKENTRRIKDDAYIAIDSLQSILYAGEEIHEDYLAEKVRTVKNCVRFFESFIDDGSK